MNRVTDQLFDIPSLRSGYRVHLHDACSEGDAAARKRPEDIRPSVQPHLRHKSIWLFRPSEHAKAFREEGRKAITQKN